MTSINFNIIRERCPGCDSNVLSHHKIIICESCDTIYHAKCSEQSFKFDHVKQMWHCSQCYAFKFQRYNPFNSIIYDKYDPNTVERDEDMETISTH